MSKIKIAGRDVMCFFNVSDFHSLGSSRPAF